MAGGNGQRAVLYPEDMPPPEGMPDRPNKKASWISRRNYTWSVIDNSARESKWWNATGPTFANAKYIQGTGGLRQHYLRHQHVRSRRSVQDHADTQRLLRAQRQYTERRGWQQVSVMGRCLITFGASTRKKRRNEADNTY